MPTLDRGGYLQRLAQEQRCTLHKRPEPEDGFPDNGEYKLTCDRTNRVLLDDAELDEVAAFLRMP